jgi:Fe-S-cluster-containing dehydrogenase component
MKVEFDLMMKCDMCYDRTSIGKKPWCATVCPSGALWFGTRDEIEQKRPLSISSNSFQFGAQHITTKVRMMLPKQRQAEYLDVTAAMNEHTTGKSLSLDVLSTAMYSEDDDESNSI